MNSAGRGRTSSPGLRGIRLGGSFLTTLGSSLGLPASVLGTSVFGLTASGLGLPLSALGLSASVFLGGSFLIGGGSSVKPLSAALLSAGPLSAGRLSAGALSDFGRP